MELIIDIPDKVYNDIEPFLNGEKIKGGFNLFYVLELIKKGTPLPEHHGRLIDADALQMEMEKDVRKAMSFVDLKDFVWLAPTIIEGSDSE